MEHAKTWWHKRGIAEGNAQREGRRVSARLKLLLAHLTLQRLSYRGMRPGMTG